MDNNYFMGMELTFFSHMYYLAFIVVIVGVNGIYPSKKQISKHALRFETQMTFSSLNMPVDFSILSTTSKKHLE